jgi:FG-GAP-like repeat
MDFIASRGHDRGVLWFEAPRWTRHEIDADIKEPHSLTALDMDGDGDIDAATCAYGDQVAAWYQNNGKGNFHKQVIGDNQEAYDIRVIDMDNDGDLDVLIAGRGSNNVVWYEQQK